MADGEMSVQTGSHATEEAWEKAWLGVNNAENADRPVSETLIKNIERLTGGVSGCTVFLPLCGMSNDIKWLVDRGHKVVGVDIVGKAFHQFFGKYSMKYTVSDMPNVPGGNIFENAEGTIKLFKCNIFDMDMTLLGEVDGIWDCGALIVISSAERRRYAELMTSLLKPGKRILCQSYDFGMDVKDQKKESDSTEQQTAQNPGDITEKGTEEEFPSAYISDKDYETIYGEHCGVEFLGDHDAMNEFWAEMGCTWALDRIHLITMK